MDTSTKNLTAINASNLSIRSKFNDGWINLDEKIEHILNKTLAKNFAKRYPSKQVFINNLKQLRDKIVHTKSGDNYESYTSLFKTTLNFKFNGAIEAIRDFINYYEPNLIEPCTCGADF